MKKILIVEDQQGMRRSLELLFRKEGFAVRSAADGPQALAIAGEFPPDVVVSDLRLDGMSGIELLPEIKRLAPRCEVILMTAYGTIDSAVEAMRLGAFDYVTKPFKKLEIMLRVRRALEKCALVAEVGQLREEIDAQHRVPFPAASPAMRAVLERIRQIAHTRLTVLITGETGTGKSMLARHIHQHSPRAGARFVAVNCAALPEPLLESELFGHTKGAFTGATQGRKGLIEEAHGGTLFLDEIGTLPLGLQSKLLGVLQEREIRRVGANDVMPVDVRFIAATNADLEAAVARGEFREDLYYRLNVARLALPPLRDRREDIPVLAAHFLAQQHRAGARAERLDSRAQELLLAYAYPGNVRELQNAIEWAAAVARTDTVQPEDLPDEIREPRAGEFSAVPQQAPRPLDQYERELILESIARNRGNLTRAAKALGIGRTTLWRRMREYNIGK
ncbi:MAG: sigma-54 dependent transcriptional regulator [Gammaproteobacteria bacterium]